MKGDRKIKGITIVVAFFLLSFFFLSCSAFLYAQSVSFRVTAVNPSSTKTQTTQIKKYLPEEVGPDDILDLGGLELEYDSERSRYYVYMDTVELIPKEVRAFEIEVADIWRVDEGKLVEINDRVEVIMLNLEGTGYFEKADPIANFIYQRLGNIRTSQNEETTRPRHIGIYRSNLVILAEIKEDVARLEAILKTAGGPQAPDMLVDSELKADLPTKTMTWIIVFIIIVFSGLLAGVLFFTWHHQGRVGRDALDASKQSAFPAGGQKKE